MPDFCGMEKTDVERFWRTIGTVPIAVEHWDELDSTNDRARKVCSELGYPVLVTAAHQRRGRGRLGRSWRDEPGTAVLMTIGFPPGFLRDDFPPLGLAAAAALSVLAVVSRYTSPQQLRLKYPNDVWAKPPGKPSGKLCGILLEMDYVGGQRDVATVGIGLNRSRSPRIEDAVYPIYCLADVALVPLPSSQVLAETIAENFLDRLMHQQPHRIMAQWQQQLGMVGRTVVLRPDGRTVRVIGHAPDGALLAEQVGSGECLIIRDSDSLTYDPFSP